jgi:GGDEF domain-containing protein
VGGDEFAVLIAEGDEVAARLLAAELSGLIRRRGGALQADMQGEVTASIGMQWYGLNRADTRLPI